MTYRAVDDAYFAHVARHARTVVMAIVSILACAIVEHFVAIETRVSFRCHVFARPLASIGDILLQVGACYC